MVRRQWIHCVERIDVSFMVDQWTNRHLTRSRHDFDTVVKRAIPAFGGSASDGDGDSENGGNARRHSVMSRRTNQTATEGQGDNK